MIEYFLNNKEWIFSGVGLLAITSFISVVFRRKNNEIENLKSRLNLQQNNNSNVQINGQSQSQSVIVNVDSKIGEVTSSEAYSLDKNMVVSPLKKINKLTPAQITEKLNGVPVLMRNEMITKIKGLKVEWNTTLSSASYLDDNLIQLFLKINEDGSQSDIAICKVSKNDYAELAMASKGTPIRIIGEIDSIDLCFNLKNVQLLF